MKPSRHQGGRGCGAQEGPKGQFKHEEDFELDKTKKGSLGELRDANHQMTNVKHINE